jgi:hypothetical protein
MDPVTIAALISAGSGLFGSLLGRGAQANAAKEQARAGKQAADIAFKDRAAQTAVNQYELEQQAAAAHRQAVLRNAFLRSLGVTGLEDPAMAAPPNLTGILKGAGDGNAIPRGVTFGALAGITPPEAPPVRFDTGGPLMGAPRTLGDLFAARR